MRLFQARQGRHEIAAIVTTLCTARAVAVPNGATGSPAKLTPVADEASAWVFAINGGELGPDAKNIYTSPDSQIGNRWSSATQISYNGPVQEDLINSINSFDGMAGNRMLPNFTAIAAILFIHNLCTKEASAVNQTHQAPSEGPKDRHDLRRTCI